MKLLKEGDGIKVDENRTGDTEVLSWVDHYIGVRFPPIPYLWHHDDFVQPYPIYGIVKIPVQKMVELVGIGEDFDDKNTDCYILAQYKKEECWYSDDSDNDEVYLAYHTWLYNKDKKSNAIAKNTPRLTVYKYKTGIYKVFGEIEHSKHYPDLGRNKKGTPGGIPMESMDERVSTIHKHQRIIRFSSVGVCNFRVKSENCAFVSVMEDPEVCLKYGSKKIDAKRVVVLHIFRNKMDDSPDNLEYGMLLEEFGLF